MGESFFNIPFLGGMSAGLVISINVLVVRYVLQYIKETREEYARRLTKAIIELEAQKTLNARLEFELERERLRHLNK